MFQDRHRARPPLALLLVPAMALVAILPLILRGCSCGHDFDFHLLSWFEAAAQFRNGNLHPSWAFSPAFNAGEPRFVFYPPISWILGALLGLAIPWPAVPIVLTWIALATSGATMYRLARQWTGTSSALLAAALYIANPYMLFTAYERTAYAELLAAAWLPLLLSAALRSRISIPRIAISVALLWLTNAPAGVMGCYALALIALIRVVRTWFDVRRESPAAAMKAYASVAFRFASGATLGLALAAFYIVPAAWERRWVQIAMATISGMSITDNFLFHHTADPLHDIVLHTASVISIILLAAASGALTAGLVRSRRDRGILIPLAILSGAIALMLTPLSSAVWRIAPEMAFLQFPWRLLAVLAPAACLTIALAIEATATIDPGTIDSVAMDPGAPAIRRLVPGWVSNAGTLCLVAAIITLPAASIFRQPCDDEDTVAARLALFNARSGTEPTDEYTPSEADNDSLAHASPAYWLAETPEDKPKASAQTGPLPMHFTTSSPGEEDLILNLRDFPAWQVSINGSIVSRRETRQDGLVAIPVPAGPLHVDVTYIHGIDYTVGDALSLAALTALALIALRQRNHSRRVSS